MLQIIAGGKGSGKTKKMLSMANEDVTNIKGHMVFIDANNAHMYDLDHDIRFIDMSEFPVESKNDFFGFLCGMISNDYDVEKMYIDGIFKFTSITKEDLVTFVPRLNALSKQFKFDIVLAVSSEVSELAEEINQYLVK